MRNDYVRRLEALVRSLLDYGKWDEGEEVNGADLVEFVGAWREDAAEVLRGGEQTRT